MNTPLKNGPEIDLDIAQRKVAWLRQYYLLDRLYVSDKLVASLYELAGVFDKLNRHEEALTVIQEVETLNRDELATTSQRAALALTLEYLGAVFHKLSRHDEELGVRQKAVALYRALAIAQPAIFVEDLARTWIKLNDTLRYMGRYEDALKAAKMAVKLANKHLLSRRQTLVVVLSRQLESLEYDFINLGRHDDVLGIALEKVKLFRCVHVPKTAVFARELAISLQGLGNVFSHMGRYKDSMDADLEALGLYQFLHGPLCESDLSQMASCLINVSDDLKKLGYDEKSYRFLVEAKDLLQCQSEASGHTLAICLMNMGISLSQRGKSKDSILVTRESVAIFKRMYELNHKEIAGDYALSLVNLGCRCNEQKLCEEEYSAMLEAAVIYRKLYADCREQYASDLAMTLINLACSYDEMNRPGKSKAARHEAGVALVNQSAISPERWVEQLSTLALELDTAISLRQIHLGALKRIGDLRRLGYFDSTAGSEFLKLQAVLVADLWYKVSDASLEDPELLDDSLAILVSAFQSPDLMRWLADNQRDSPEGHALAHAEDEMRRAQDTLHSVLKRLGGGHPDDDLLSPGSRRIADEKHSVASMVQLKDAKEREANSREALQKAQRALAEVDPAFASAYEIPTIHELRAMLARLQQASTAKHKGEADTAALLCFLELPAQADQASRLVGVLLSSESTRARQIEFPGLRELAQKFEQYKPLGQRSSQTLRLLRDSTSQSSPSQSEQSPSQDFELLLGELEQLWWAPLATALGEELLGLKVLHLCSHGIAHQLPFSQVSHLSLSGNVQLFQWPGLPYLRLACDQGYTNTATEVQSAPALWQVAHDCAWHDKVPLPMVAVEAHLLRQIIGSHAHNAQSIDTPEQIQSNAHALVVCSHGSKAQGVNSAVQLKGGNLTTGDVMRRKLGPRMALIPACHAADTADDHAHNALGVAAGFLLSGSRLVVGSIKAVPDTLMPWFSTLLTWYVVHEELGLHAAAVRARQDFGAGEVPAEYVCWIKANLPQALACLHPQGEESQHWADRVPKDSLKATVRQWPWQAMDKDALVPKRPVDLQTMQAAAQQVAAHAFVPLGPQTRQQMREMAAFLVVFGMG